MVELSVHQVKVLLRVCQFEIAHMSAALDASGASWLVRSPVGPIAAATAQGRSTPGATRLPEQFDVAPLVADPTA